MSEYTLKRTNYPHPSITSGMHTNGPAKVWVKADGLWYDTGSHRLHAVEEELKQNGPSRIVKGTWNEYENSN
jgi:hypothetical protein